MKPFQIYLHLLLFLSSTATPPALAKYAKTGCNDKCGNVTIPYPFGLVAECSINKWYIIDCKDSTPYLSALKDLKVLGVDLRNQTVTVSMPRISDCQNQVRNSSQMMSFDLGDSPFLFSKLHNKFVLEGCGNAAMMYDGSVVAGCSSTCRNVTDSNCIGIRCCQTEIPHSIKSYSINLKDMERHGEDGGCGSAFLVDETSYEEGRPSDPFIFKNASFIPVSLLWTLIDTDHLTCCEDRPPVIRKVIMFNGNAVDTLRCSNSWLLEGNPYLIDGCTAIPKYAKRGCIDTCGGVTIPYPFGIGARCAVNQWYIVNCNSSTPYLSAFNHLELLGVNLEDQTVNVSTQRISYCQKPVRNNIQTMSIDLSRSPFFFSKSNKFVFKGCGTASMMNNGSVVTGCSTTCDNVTLQDKHNCFGIGCCETAIPQYLKSYNIHLTGLEEEDGACTSAFLVAVDTSYDKGKYPDSSIVRRNSSVIPMSLLWTITDSDQVTCCYNVPPERRTVVKVDPTEECKRCEENGGHCRSDRIYDIDGLVFSQNFICYHYDRKSLGVILGVSISMGVLFLVALSYVLYKVIKKAKETRRRKRFFKRNGGLLLKQQEEADPSLVNKTIHFTSVELQKATNNFNENRILGRGGQGTVYKGMLVDGRIVVTPPKLPPRECPC